MDSTDSMLSNSPEGSIDRALGTMLKGIVHSGGKPILNIDEKGIEKIFFTRPLLNMSDTNLANDRIMSNLITNTGNDIQTYIRQALDPRLEYDERFKTPTDFFDNDLSYLSVLTNAAVELTGFPDRTMDNFSGKAGPLGQKYVMPDGVFNKYEPVELDATFQRTYGNIVDRLISVWCQYMALQNKGMLVPRWRDEYRGRKNYDSRIYRINLDATGTLVTGIAAASGVYPIVDNKGKEYNFSRDTFRDKGKETNIRFMAAYGVEYEDPILVHEFNQHTAVCCSEVSRMLNGEAHEMVKIPRVYKNIIKDTGYPVIDIETMELGWWIRKSSAAYEKLTKLIEEGNSNEQ